MKRKTVITTMGMEQKLKYDRVLLGGSHGLHERVLLVVVA